MNEWKKQEGAITEFARVEIRAIVMYLFTFLETSISITDTIYSQCTVYNIRLEAYSHQKQTIFRYS
jgi:hypothetical protein